AIGFVFALLGAATWWLRARSRGTLGLIRPRNSGLQIIDRVQLTSQHSVHILKSGERELTIAVHPAGCTLLATRIHDKEKL
ncbi:MAG: flagellar biosynthetic protein FliO, partial [Bryobacteraceae bacterium]